METDPHEPDDDAPDAADVVVAVTVSRSGGIAGMTRRWAVQAPPADPDRWRALVAECPWDQAGEGTDPGADRFAWTVRATLRHTSRRAELTETDVSGPWRALIDAVRAASASADPSRRSAPEE